MLAARVRASTAPKAVPETKGAQIPSRARLAVGAGATAAAGLALAGCSGSNVPVNNCDRIAPSAAVSDSSVMSAAVQYRDGSYTARGVYGSLPSHQDVTLTLDRGAVTTIEITTPAQDQTSLGYQQRFATALPNAVIGRNINELNIDRLAGSSGCSEGFMIALGKIKRDAEI